MKCPRLLISHTTTTIIFFKNLSGRYHLANIWPDHLIKRADLPSGQIHITIPKSQTNQLLVWFCWFSLFWPHYYYHLSRGGQRDGHTLPGDVIAANRTVVGAGKALVGTVSTPYGTLCFAVQPQVFHSKDAKRNRGKSATSEVYNGSAVEYQRLYFFESFVGVSRDPKQSQQKPSFRASWRDKFGVSKNWAYDIPSNGRAIGERVWSTIKLGVTIYFQTDLSRSPWKPREIVGAPPHVFGNCWLPSNCMHPCATF